MAKGFGRLSQDGTIPGVNTSNMGEFDHRVRLNDPEEVLFKEGIV